MATIRNNKTRGRGFEVRWYDPTELDANGKPKQKSKTFDTRKEAASFAAARDHEAKNGDPSERKRIEEAQQRSETPFGVVAEEWYTTKHRPVEQGGVKPKTRAGYRSILDTHLLPEFGSHPVSEIDAGTVELFLSRLRASNATQRNILRVLGMVLGFAVKRRMLPSNPISLVDQPKVSSSAMLFLDEHQVRDLVEEVSPEYRVLVYTAAWTGMRAGELAALRVDRIDFLHRSITVSESLADVNRRFTDGETERLVFGKPKNGKIRTFAIPAFLADMLAEQVAGKGPSDLVFGTQTGGVLRHGNFMTRHFRPAIARLVASDENPTWTPKMLGLRFHDLRHTAAALMIAGGAHPKAIADRLGHSSITITMDRYGKLFPSVDEAVADSLDARFRAAASREVEPEREVATIA